MSEYVFKRTQQRTSREEAGAYKTRSRPSSAWGQLMELQGRKKRTYINALRPFFLIMRHQITGGLTEILRSKYHSNDDQTSRELGNERQPITGK